MVRAPQAVGCRVVTPHRLALALAACFGPLWAVAAPQGGVVVKGAASIAQSGAITTIDQSSHQATINWQGFSIGAAETVRFKQADASAITLNRVIGTERSVIDGVLSANGKVFLVNANGVLFRKGSSVATGSLLASALDISDADFAAGRHVFQARSTAGEAAVVNQGMLSAAEGGFVALLGRSVSNEGLISASRGTVALAAGQRVSLRFDAGSLLGVSVDEGTLNALVNNQGAVLADGGKVWLTARAADGLLSAQVNTSGLIRARTLDDLRGEIVLNAVGGQTHVAGTLDASAPTQGNGGTIETSGHSVQVADSARITTRAAQGRTGSWTVDPDGFTVGSGGDISADALARQLADNNVALSSTAGSGQDGDLTVKDAVSWAANTTLTLSATRDVRVNAPITATGEHAGLVLQAGGDYLIDTAHAAAITLSGAQASLSIQGSDYTLVHDMAGLLALSTADSQASGHYALAQDIDAVGSSLGSSPLPVLSGTLAGLGHDISHLSVVGPDASSYNQGLVGTITASGTVRDLGLVDANVSALMSVGALAGENDGHIVNAYSSGSVSGNYYVGGLVGLNLGSITSSYSSAQVSGATYDVFYSAIGGLVGGSVGGSISDSHALGKVAVISSDLETSLMYVGGLVGDNINATIARSYAKGDVIVSTNGTYVGGLAGESVGPQAVISDSYATGQVTGGQGPVGGLVGSNGYGASITGSYATGAVSGLAGSGPTSAGGLAGENLADSTITGSYATGNVSGSSTYLGGLVGGNAGSIYDSSASGTITATANNSLGGLVGSNGGLISGSHATGDVVGEYAGGLAASNAGTIVDSSASGNVTGSYAAGGLVGANVGSIANSQASGTVDSQYVAGGALVASNSGSISNSGATGTVRGAPNTSGDPLTGDNTGTVSGSRYQNAAAASQLGSLDSAAVRGEAAQPVASPAAAPAARPPVQLDAKLVVLDPASYSANIRRIEVDGKVYELEDDSAAAKAPGRAASAAPPTR